VLLVALCIYNNKNNNNIRIYIVPYCRNFRGTEARQCASERKKRKESKPERRGMFEQNVIKKSKLRSQRDQMLSTMTIDSSLLSSCFVLNLDFMCLVTLVGKAIRKLYILYYVLYIL